MSDDPGDLVAAYFDGTLDEAGEAALNAWVKASPANARRFAAEARLHDRLRDLHHPAPPAAGAPERVRTTRRLALAGGATAALALTSFVAWWAFPRPLRASTELDRLIEVSAAGGDRTYLVRSLDSRPEAAEPRRPPIDGATLHVRGRDRYVLIRRFPDGRPFVTGCDGTRSFSIPPDGDVRISDDPTRFRGPVPGQQQGLPFVDPTSDLSRLREAYTLTLLPPDPEGELRGLLAVKRSREHRGPRRVELWYGPRDGAIRRMTLDGMPRARGGPESLAVVLVDTDDLGADFFRHESHHGPDRRVVEEDRVPRPF